MNKALFAGMAVIAIILMSSADVDAKGRGRGRGSDDHLSRSHLFEDTGSHSGALLRTGTDGSLHGSRSRGRRHHEFEIETHRSGVHSGEFESHGGSGRGR